MSAVAFDIAADEGHPVDLPSGAVFRVLTTDEADYLRERVTRYLEDNHFVNVADFQDVDKMVVFELFIHRWSLWLSLGKDYFNEDLDQNQARALAGQIDSYSTQLRQLKKALGIDKTARDRQRGDDSIPVYLDNLRQRAREFGVMRNEQLARVIEAFQRLKAMLVFHDNCDELERVENQVTVDDMFDVLRKEIEAFDKIDADFRANKQRLWIRRQ